MEFFATTASADRQKTDCAIVGVFDKGVFGTAAAALDQRSHGRLQKLVKRGDLKGKSGELLLLADVTGMPAERVLLVGLGSKSGFGRKQYRKALQSALGAVLKTGAHDTVNYLSLEQVKDADAYAKARTTAEVVGHVRYRIPDLKSSSKPPKSLLTRVGVAVAERGEKAQAERGLEHGEAISTGMALMRDLANLPPNVCTPTYLAKAGTGLARDYKKIRARVLNESEMRSLKMGALLSVSAGSAEPAKLIVLEYRNGGASAPFALVGKGVTFDTGGISLKPPPAMDEMKFDMSGAASVLGTFKAVAELDLPVNLVGIIPSVENMPSGTAVKPGDIVKSMSGQTVEILNTDAEGRLILCDAITYVRRFKPQTVIDIATLTGACVVALGNPYSGLFSNDDELAGELGTAGERAEDRAWHLPAGEEYAEQLKSNFADFANVAGRDGGASTAAAYLSKFAEGLRWAHLDVAGTAYLSGSAKSSTGRPVPLLVQYLLDQL